MSILWTDKPPEFQALAQARLVLGGRDWQMMAASARTERARRIALAAEELVKAIDQGEFPWEACL